VRSHPLRQLCAAARIGAKEGLKHRDGARLNFLELR
jgi:hypothetical protein